MMKSSVMSRTKRNWLRRTLARQLKSTFVIPAVGAGLMIGASALPVQAASTYTVTNGNDSGIGSLRQVIEASNAGDTIVFNVSQITLTNDLPLIDKDLYINGGTAGVVIDAGSNRGFVVGDGTSPVNVNFNNLIIKNAVAQGANGFGGGVGGGGGGGGAGLGGAIFVNSNSNVTLNSVTFWDNQAQGGDGGDGEGSNSGDGGASSIFDGGDWGASNSLSVVGDGTIGGTITDSAATGGSGGTSIFGGGGGGGSATISVDNNGTITNSDATGGSGGTSTFGGGGGGGVATIIGEGTNNTATDGTGGASTFGGDGGSGGAGGGGAGLGGAVFVRKGGSLTIEGNTFIHNNVVAGGTGYQQGQAGGSGIFLNSQNLKFNIVDGESTFIADDIADSSAGNPNDPEVGAGSITKNGAGTLILGGNNTYTGGTLVNGGTLQLSNATDDVSLGSSVTVDGGMFEQTGAASGTTNTINGAVNVNNDAVYNVSGTHNAVTGGVSVTSSSGAHVGDVDESGSGTVGTPLIIHNELATSEITADVGGHIHIGTNDASAEQTISGDYKNITNRIVGDQDLEIEGTITIKGDASVLGLGDGLHDSSHDGLGDLHFIGIGNTVNNIVSSANTLSQNAQLQTVTGGGKVLLGGRKVLSSGTGNIVNNTVDQDVVLGADSNDSGILELAGANSVGGNPATVNNIVTGNVTANGSSEVYLYGSGANASNAINGSLTLNDSSSLTFGSIPEFLDNTIISNYIGGKVTVGMDSTSTIKVLSGGSGGIGNADGQNIIQGDLILNSKSTFVVNTDGSISTGLQVDGNVDLNLMNLQVNYNGTAAPTLNQRISLVEAIGDGHSLLEGFSNDSLSLLNAYDGFWEKYRVRTGVENNTAYLEFLNRLFALSGSRNQQTFQQYLNNLLENTDTDGISDLLDLLNDSSNPNKFINFLGDNYSAFGMLGYQNASNFVRGLAKHSQNPLYAGSAQSGDNPLYELNFADNGARGLSGVNAQLSLVKQMLHPRPAMQLAANGNNGNGGNSLWGSVSGHWLRNDGDSSLGSPDWSQNSKSVTLGYQSGGETFSWGIAGGYHEGDIDFNNRDASGENDGWNAGLNALWQSKNHTYVNGVLSLGHESNNLTRNDGLGSNRSDFNARSYAALLEVGKRIDRKTVSFTPYASLLGVKYQSDAFSENGTGAGLTVDGESHSYLTSTVGIRVNRTFLDESGQTRGGVMLGVNWQHQFSGTNFPVTASLNGAMGASTFTTYGTPLSSNSLGIQLGGYARLTDDLFGFLNYSGNFGGEQKINSVTAGLQYGF